MIITAWANILIILDCIVMDFLSRINEGANPVRIDKFTAIFARNTYASLQKSIEGRSFLRVLSPGRDVRMCSFDYR